MKLHFNRKKIDEDLSRVLLFEENDNCPCTIVEVNTCPKTNICQQEGSNMKKYFFRKTTITENLNAIFIYAEDKNCTGECKPKPESNICPVTNKCS